MADLDQIEQKVKDVVIGYGSLIEEVKNEGSDIDKVKQLAVNVKTLLNNLNLEITNNMILSQNFQDMQRENSELEKELAIVVEEKKELFKQIDKVKESMSELN